MITRRRQVITPPTVAAGTISITRRAAFGDVICATVVADAVARMGFKVQFNTLPVIRASGILNHHKSIDSFGELTAPSHIGLDNTYDHIVERKTRLSMSIFYQQAIAQLGKHGIVLRPEYNLRPQLNILPDEVEAERNRMSPFPRPWVIVVPKSNSWSNRTVNQDVWSQVAHNVHGTMLWTGTDRINDANIVDMMCKDMRRIAAMMAAADLVVGVDTGPMWCAAGVNAPILGITQARPFRITMNDQVDWQDVSADLDCIGCSEHKCPINVDHPPCQLIPASLLSSAINTRLETFSGHKVSAVIPCLHDRDPRLQRCLDAVMNQVDEVIVSLDGDGTGEAISKHPKLKILRNPSGVQTGFSHTCNRGARVSSGRFILFLNDDLYLDAGAVRAMKQIAVRPDVAVVGGLWRYPDGTIQHGGGQRYHGDVGFGHRDWKKKDPTIITETEMEFVTAACVMVRREAFFRVGAFGEEFGNYSEDADLCMKVRQAGWKVVYQPAATGIHEESQTTTSDKTAMRRESGEVFREKWHRYFTHNHPERLGVFT